MVRYCVMIGSHYLCLDGKFAERRDRAWTTPDYDSAINAARQYGAVAVPY